MKIGRARVFKVVGEAALIVVSVTREHVPLIWDRRTGVFVRTDRASKLDLDNQLVHLEIWNDSYGRLLDLWADEIQQVLQQVAYRTEGGI